MRLTPVLTRNALYFSFIILVIAIWGFWKSYFSNPFQVTDWVRQIHGLGMTLWCVMLIVQIWLVKTKQVALHRLIGKFAYILAPLNVILMLAVVRIRVPLFANMFEDGQLNEVGHFFVAAGFVDAGLYGLLFALAIKNRHRAAIHARYMICTPLPVMAAATDRVVNQYFPGVGSFWIDTIGAVHQETMTWLLANCCLLLLAIMEWRSKQPVNVFGRVLLIFLPCHGVALFWHQIPLLSAVNAWFLGLPVLHH